MHRVVRPPRSPRRRQFLVDCCIQKPEFARPAEHHQLDVHDKQLPVVGRIGAFAIGVAILCMSCSGPDTQPVPGTTTPSSGVTVAPSPSPAATAVATRLPTLDDELVRVLHEFALQQGFSFGGVPCSEVTAGETGLCYRQLEVGEGSVGIILGRPASDLAWRFVLRRSPAGDYSITEAVRLNP
jgi:hypothetical protein